MAARNGLRGSGRRSRHRRCSSPSRVWSAFYRAADLSPRCVAPVDLLRATAAAALCREEYGVNSRSAIRGRRGNCPGQCLRRRRTVPGRLVCQPLRTRPVSKASGSATHPPASLRDETRSPHRSRPSPLPECRRLTRSRANPEQCRLIPLAFLDHDGVTHGSILVAALPEGALQYARLQMGIW